AAMAEIRDVLADQGLTGAPVGVDMAETSIFLELVAQGFDVRDGQQPMMLAREVKSRDEIMLLTQACAMVDGVYQHIFEALKPGVRESQIVALATAYLFDVGAETVEAVNSIAGERCSPHPHVFSDRLLRPGDQAYFDIINVFNGYRTCYYRTFAVGRASQPQRDAFKQAREWMDAAIDLVRPGVTTDEIARVWPEAHEYGFENEMEAFGLQFGHGVGVGLHERPIISRLNSLTEPIEIVEGMVFALETYAPATDRRSAARIEEEVVVTPDGPQVITLFPCEELMVANAY
ncbi:MAG: Xaa-Pro peptidase family protein, partial [bacterium]|nr:Xaa-Pro peptidase family protein [bacterium]